jgi:FtsH-binding integral membrane protein
MDDPLAWVLRLVAPGLICVCLAAALLIVAAVRQREPPPWSIRLLWFGLALVALLPGVATLVAVATGDLLLPAALGGAVGIVYGIRFLARLRRDWDYQPQSRDAP